MAATKHFPRMVSHVILDLDGTLLNTGVYLPTFFLIIFFILSTIYISQVFPISLLS